MSSCTHLCDYKTCFFLSLVKTSVGSYIVRSHLIRASTLRWLRITRILANYNFSQSMRMTLFVSSQMTFFSEFELSVYVNDTWQDAICFEAPKIRKRTCSILEFDKTFAWQRIRWDEQSLLHALAKMLLRSTRSRTIISKSAVTVAHGIPLQSVIIRKDSVRGESRKTL